MGENAPRKLLYRRKIREEQVVLIYSFSSDRAWKLVGFLCNRSLELGGKGRWPGWMVNG